MELQVIQKFRADVPAADPDARRAARDALVARIEAAPRPRRWPRLAVVLVAIAVAAGMAASALALYDFIAGEPAPPDVTRLLVEEGTAERIGPVFAANPDVIARAARGVAALDTSAGRVLLWAAPTRDGPTCYFVEFERRSEQVGTPQGEANCVPEVLSPGFPFVFALHRTSLDKGTSVAILVGRAHESVASVTLHPPEGDRRELPLFDNFFLAEIPADRVPKGPRAGEAYEVVATDRLGGVMTRLDVTDFSGSIWLQRFPKVSGPKRSIIETTDSHGRTIRLSLIPIEGGQTCIEMMTRNGTSTACGPELRVDKGIQVHPTLMGSIVLLNGSVGPEVAKLELHHEDGYVVELPIVERYVFHGIPRARFEEGKRPILLVARARDDAEVAREEVGQKLFDGAMSSGRDVAP